MSVSVQCNHSKPYPGPADDVCPPHMRSSKARSSREAAAAKARGAVVWASPSGRDGGFCVGSPARPISTEWIASLFAESEDAAAVARFTGATLAQVWAAVWFEQGMDAKRRYWM